MRTMPADIVREAPPAAPAGAMPAEKAVPTNAMGATGAMSAEGQPMAVPPGDARAPRAPVEPPVLGLGRYGNGYLP